MCGVERGTEQRLSEGDAILSDRGRPKTTDVRLLLARLPPGVPRWVVRDVLVPFAATRAALLITAVVALSRLPRAPDPGGWRDVSPHAWVNAWARWDARWYVSIVEEGYSFRPGEQSNIAFSPLLPSLMKVGGIVFGTGGADGWVLVGVLVSNVALVAALIHLVGLVRLEVDDATAARAALYLLVFPTTLFLSGVYPESLFLALAAAAFYHARRERWWLVGALAGLAALARPHGVLIVLPLGFEYLARRRFDVRALRPDILALGLGPVALAGWLIYLYRLADGSWSFLTVYAAWDRKLTPPWQVLQAYVSGVLANQLDHYALVDVVFTLVFLVLVAASWWRLRPSLALFAGVFFLVPASSGNLVSFMRYGLVLFPAFIVLAIVGRRPAFHQTYLIIATSLASLFMAAFALGYWVA